MKRLFNNLCLLMLIILLLPYVVTAFMTGSSERKGHKQNLEIIWQKNGEQINLNLDEYITGVISAVIPAHYELETLKAQAVIIRTFAAGIDTEENQISVEDLGFAYFSEAEMEEIWSQEELDSIYSKIAEAVETTKDEVIYYNNQLILPLFHSVSTGMTRDARDVLGDGYPYLLSNDSSEDTGSDEYMSITEETAENISTLLNEQIGADVLTAENFYENMLILERDSYGYVRTAEIGGITVTGEEIAECLSLNSSNFYFQDYEGKIRIICKGKGHGLGFSQYGANEKAKDGMDYKGLLNYYYTNIKINKMI